MRPNGRNRNYNPNRNREYLEDADENTQRDYQNYGSESDDSESGFEGGRYGSGQARSQGQNQGQQYPSSGYYNRYDEPRRAQNSSDENFRSYGRGSNDDRNYRSGRGGQQNQDSDSTYGRGNYQSPSRSSRYNQNSGSSMGYGDAEEQGRYGYRGGSQQSERQGGHFGKGPKGYQRSDERIKEDVNEALSRHWDVDASNIEVEVKDGEVTLTGSVDSREAKRYAEDAVENCFGVKDVENKLKVKKDSNASWGSEIDTGSSSSKTGSKPGESSSMGEVRRGAGTTSGSASRS